MSDPKQSQSAGENSFAIQSAGNTTINTGISPEQMVQLMQAMQAIADAATKNLAQADDISKERLDQIAERVYKKFAEDKTARLDAFREPDFKYVLMKACEEHARFGDEYVLDALVGLIIRRSKETQHGRLSLSLNDALETAAQLTRNEYAELSFVFLMRYTGLQPQDLKQLVERLRQHLLPLMPNISNLHSSYEYLESKSCARIDLTSATFESLLRSNYAGLFSKGFENDTLSSPLFVGLNPLQIFTQCLNDSSKLQLAVLNKATLQSKVPGLEQERLDQIYSMFDATLMTEQEMMAMLAAEFPEISQLAKLWNETPLQNLILTTLGKTIGHSNLAQLSSFDADLSIWIQ